MTEESQAARLAQTLERLLALLGRRGGRLAEAESQPHTPTQRLALATIADTGSLRLVALAELMETTEATACRTVDALATLDLVRREPDLADRRGIRVAATSRGRRRVDEGRALLVSLVEELLADASPEDQGRLADLLSELGRLLERAPGGRRSS